MQDLHVRPNDDEDGITFITPLVPGNEACVSVTAVNGTGSATNLYGFIDYNGDGDFDSDTDDPLTGGVNGTPFSGGIANMPSGGVTDTSYCFAVPAGATFDGGETHFRFRLTSDTLGSNTWAGLASDGEVEDYYAQLACVGNHVWLDNGGTANEQDGTDTAIPNVTLNLIFDNDGTGGINLGSDATYTTTTDSNGEYHFCGLIPGTYRVDIPTPPFSDIVTKDIGGDEDTDSDGSQVGGSGTRVTGDELNITDVTTQPAGENSTGDENGSAGPNNYPDNQVNQQQDFGFSAVFDWGDLPDPVVATAGQYPTLNANSGPSHAIAAGVHLGACVDAEGDGVASAAGTAAGDDSAVGTVPAGSGTCVGDDDEDGISFSTPLSDNSALAICSTFDLTLTGTMVAGGSGIINLWADLNNNGQLEAGEQIVTNNTVNGSLATAGSLSFPAGATTAQTINNIAVPCDSSLIGENLYIRARYTNGTGQGGENVTGPATNGEVEDYVLPIYGWDFSDAPDGTDNQTDSGGTDYAASGNGARHIIISNNPYFGSVTPDSETAGSGTTDASVNSAGDNTSGSDEDGFASVFPDNDWSDGSGSVQLTVGNLGSTGKVCVYGWLDWDKDGFITVDGNATDGGNSYTSELVTSTGTVTLTFNSDLPTSGSFPDSAGFYMRYRIVPVDSAAVSCTVISPIGPQVGGEVEDFFHVPATPTSVTLNDTNADNTAQQPIILILAFTVLSLLTGWVWLRRSQSAM